MRVDRAGSALFASGRPRPAALDRPRQDVDGDPQADREPQAGPACIQVDFLDAKNGYFLAQGGALWRTANAGKSWTALPGDGHRQGLRHRLLVEDQGLPGHRPLRRRPDRSGFLLKTTDSGGTWHPQFVVSERIQGGGIAATAGGTDYLLGGAVELPVHDDQRRGRQGAAR